MVMVSFHFFRVNMHKVFATVLACLVLSACESNPAKGVLSVQRLLIESNLGWGSGFVTRWGQDVEAVTAISDTIFYVENWYTTRMSGDREIRYQMTVEKSGETYYNRCFVTHEEIEDGADACF